MSISSYKAKELDCLKMYLAEPVVFQLTEPEVRACTVVLIHTELDLEIPSDHAQIADRLLGAE